MRTDNSVRPIALVFIACSLLLGVGLAACGGSNQNGDYVQPVANSSPTPSPSPTATAVPGVLASANCEVGPNYVNFQNAAGQYVAAPGYGVLSIGNAAALFAALNVNATAQTAAIQSINEPAAGPGPISLLSPFITFSGASYQLVATQLPAGLVGFFTPYDNPDGTSYMSFDVTGNVVNNGTQTGTFDLTFHASFPYTVAQLFTALPLDSVCNVVAIGPATSARLRHASSRPR